MGSQRVRPARNGACARLSRSIRAVRRMGMGDIVVMTDHGSGEGSRPLLKAAVEILTGTLPVSIDARHFMTGGYGRAVAARGTVRLIVPSEDLVATPDVLVVYEIPPVERWRFETFQRTLRSSGSTCWGADVDAWRAATDKHQTVARFRRDGIAHMETIALCCPDRASALDAFTREHVQADPQAPCNESLGAVSTTVAVDDFPPEFAQLAISATRSLGLPFGGVDLAIENGGVIFEVNVHPVIDVPGGLETVAIPLIQAHLSPSDQTLANMR
jgi:hypothetical protein